MKVLAAFVPFLSAMECVLGQLYEMLIKNLDTSCLFVYLAANTIWLYCDGWRLWRWGEIRELLVASPRFGSLPRSVCSWT